MEGSWKFGLTHLLTMIGQAITVVFAFWGLLSFGRWRRQAIEQDKIKVAFEGLAFAHEAKIVFQDVRARSVQIIEWEIGDGGTVRRSRELSKKGLEIVLKRLDTHDEFFQRALGLEAKFVAAFDKKWEETFELLFRARNRLMSAVQELMDEVNIESDPSDIESRQRLRQLRANVFASRGELREHDEVGKLLAEFKEKIEKECRPFVTQRFGGSVRWLERLGSGGRGSSVEHPTGRDTKMVKRPS